MYFQRLFTDFYLEFHDSLDHYWKHIVAAFPRFLMGVLAFVICIIIANLLYRLVKKALQIRSHDPLLAPFISRLARWFFIAGALMFAFDIMGFNKIAGGILAGAGISAFIIGFALKDIGENFLSGLLLVFNRHFHVGDVIKVDNYTGTVLSLNLRTTHIRTFEGNDVFVPNSKMINSTLVNVTATGLTRQSFTIGIDYQNDIDEAFRIILVTITKIEGVLQHPEPFVNVDSFTVDSVLLRIYYWYNSLEYEKSNFYLESEVKKNVKNCLVANKFDVPKKR
jgi:small-conductance mechanosensitive channel